ncbi:MAG: DNA-3-methyladenine glycosylase 2 family protein [Chloroflexota bacterium]|nr:DNA-3-methyladenine glycosylase 2 family protein [Chloroflexota bacterium]
MSAPTTTRFTVALPGPLDIAASLDLFRRAGDDMLDRWDGVRFVRTLPVGVRSIAYAAIPGGTLAAPTLAVEVAREADRAPVEAALAVTFAQPPAREYAALLRADPVVAALDARYPGQRPVRQFDLFGALVRCISAQQVNLRWAATTRRRLAETYGERLMVGAHEVYALPAERLAAASVADLRALQFTTRKAEYLIGAAQEIASGALDLATLAALPDAAVVARLMGLRGIGRWSAEWVLARTLGRPCVVAGDLAVRKVIASAYLGHTRGAPLPDEAAIRAATAHWGAAASVAQELLLHAYAASAT